MGMTIGEMAARPYPASRDELVTLYRSHVCPSACPLVLNLCQDTEMRRLVFLGVYSIEYRSHTNRARVIDRICKALGLSKRTGYRYARQYDATRVRQVK